MTRIDELESRVNSLAVSFDSLNDVMSSQNNVNQSTNDTLKAANAFIQETRDYLRINTTNIQSLLCDRLLLIHMFGTIAQLLSIKDLSPETVKSELQKVIDKMPLEIRKHATSIEVLSELSVV